MSETPPSSPTTSPATRAGTAALAEKGDPQPASAVPPPAVPPPAAVATPADPSTAPKATSGDEPALANALLADLQREMNRLQREIRVTIQAQLGQMTGRSMGSLKANKQLAKSIHTMLESHGLRVRCTQCGNPAILRVSPRPGVDSGVFVFDHTLDDRRTFHGGKATVPEIRLVAKPARKARKPTS